MGRPQGSTNVQGLSRQEKVDRLIRQYGSPLRIAFRVYERLYTEWNRLVAEYDDAVARGPSSRVGSLERRIATIEKRLLPYLHLAAPYTDVRMPSYTAINYQNSDKGKPTVIRIPAVPESPDEPEAIEEDKQTAWLKCYAPPSALEANKAPMKVIESKPQPTMQTFVPALKAAEHVAKVIPGNISAQSVIDEGRRYSLEQERRRQEEEIARRNGLGYLR
jgi:hypothetical protein